ncbi:hypothetical protein BV898_04481 [Hypsibius exemplaris]|uniref:Uncharacterized protein n=1 Tax=Hypsibius exemplaris TaxID=2072580 RepID=A0A1W0X2H9_HYPEX|nr:hypothetical protein BV898_04481 [Hypsibius exemplaris]
MLSMLMEANKKLGEQQSSESGSGGQQRDEMTMQGGHQGQNPNPAPSTASGFDMPPASQPPHGGFESH